jgi:hypothetical protein
MNQQKGESFLQEGDITVALSFPTENPKARTPFLDCCENLRIGESVEYWVQSGTQIVEPDAEAVGAVRDACVSGTKYLDRPGEQKREPADQKTEEDESNGFCCFHLKIQNVK